MVRDVIKIWDWCLWSVDFTPGWFWVLIFISDLEFTSQILWHSLKMMMIGRFVQGNFQEIHMNFTFGRDFTWKTSKSISRLHFWTKRHLRTALFCTFVLAPGLRTFCRRKKWLRVFSHLKPFLVLIVDSVKLVVQGHPKLWILGSNFKKRFLDPGKSNL